MLDCPACSSDCRGMVVELINSVLTGESPSVAAAAPVELDQPESRGDGSHLQGSPPQSSRAGQKLVSLRRKDGLQLMILLAETERKEKKAEALLEQHRSWVTTVPGCLCGTAAETIRQPFKKFCIDCLHSCRLKLSHCESNV